MKLPFDIRQAAEAVLRDAAVHDDLPSDAALALAVDQLDRLTGAIHRIADALEAK